MGNKMLAYLVDQLVLSLSLHFLLGAVDSLNNITCLKDPWLSQICLHTFIIVLYTVTEMLNE